jgi:hypothetical protein
MTHRLSHFLIVALILSPLACTDDGPSDTGADDPGDSSGDGDGDSGDGDGDSGDGDGDSGDGDGDSGDGDGDSGDGDGDSGDGDGDPTEGIAEFAPVHELFVAQGCTAGYCHGANAAGLMMTDAATSYANIVDVPATMGVCDLTQRVVPGDPEQSILWMRVRPAALDGGMPCAVKMPNDGTDNGLSEADAQIVYDWIANGALP